MRARAYASSRTRSGTVARPSRPRLRWRRSVPPPRGVAPGGAGSESAAERRRRPARESPRNLALPRRRRSPFQRSARPKTRRAAAAKAPSPRARRAGSRGRAPAPRPRAPPAAGRPPRSLLARRQVQVGRRRLRELPSDVRLVPQLVIRVGGLDRLVEEWLERPEVLAGEPVLERLPFLGEELVQVVLVLRTGEGRELHQPAHLLQLELGERPVAGLRGVVELPGPRADLGHQAAEARLDDRDVLERHLAVAGPDRDVLQALLVGHARSSSAAMP